MKENKAIALRYPEGAEAPFIAVKGQGELASRIVELARDFGVPVTENAALANVLSVYQVGDCVPPETYEILANIFAFVVKLKV